MASDHPNPVKIVVELHEGDKSTKKIWRFDPDVDVDERYTRDSVSSEIKKLFPNLLRKGLDIELHHYDELAGKVCIESDGDMDEALCNFSDEWQQGGSRREYLTLHVVDCVPAAKTSVAEDPPKKCVSRKVIHC